MSASRHLIRLVLCGTAAALAGACRDRPSADAADAGWAAVSAAQLTEVQNAQRQRGEAARDALASQLMARLTEAIGTGGPAQAIAICSTAAPELAAAVGREQGLRIGRTSRRLRNPGNTPPDWTAAHVGSEATEPAFFAHGDGRLGGLWPIVLGELCTTCHGTAEQIPAEVRESLTLRYPSDRATGFAPGELRGWFWVEVTP